MSIFAAHAAQAPALREGSIPIIDYNPRNENLSKQTLIDRGYDQKGWPFAPCGLLARPNGFDKKHQRLTFCCFKQCLKLRPKALENLHNKYNIAMCPHIRNRTGFSKHMYVNTLRKRLRCERASQVD